MSDAAGQPGNGFRFLIHELAEIEANIVALNSALFEAVHRLMVQVRVVQKSLDIENMLNLMSQVSARSATEHGPGGYVPVIALE